MEELINNQVPKNSLRNFPMETFRIRSDELNILKREKDKLENKLNNIREDVRILEENRIIYEKEEYEKEINRLKEYQYRDEEEINKLSGSIVQHMEALSVCYKNLQQIRDRNAALRGNVRSICKLHSHLFQDHYLDEDEGINRNIDRNIDRNINRNINMNINMTINSFTPRLEEHRVSVGIGDREYTFDRIYTEKESPNNIYREEIAPLVQELLTQGSSSVLSKGYSQIYTMIGDLGLLKVLLQLDYPDIQEQGLLSTFGLFPSALIQLGQLLAQSNNIAGLRCRCLKFTSTQGIDLLHTNLHTNWLEPDIMTWKSINNKSMKGNLLRFPDIYKDIRNILLRVIEDIMSTNEHNSVNIFKIPDPHYLFQIEIEKGREKTGPEMISFICLGEREGRDKETENMQIILESLIERKLNINLSPSIKERIYRKTGLTSLLKGSLTRKNKLLVISSLDSNQETQSIQTLQLLLNSRIIY